MTLYRATVLDTPGDPFTGDPAAALRAETDTGLLVADGVITARGPYAELRARHPEEYVADLQGGLLLPGFVDTHVHYPQVRAIGGLGMPLLDWLDRCALPEEARLADPGYASVIAAEFLAGLAAAGTTTALVFGSHFAPAMDAFFAAAERSGLRITAGQVVSDRLLRPELLTTPETAFAEGRALIERWHSTAGSGRLRYAVTPRFSLSTSEPVLEVCRALLGSAEGVRFTSHANENVREVARVRELFPGTRDYLDSYHRHGLVTDRSVFAHNVHATEAELELMAGHGAWAAHCPTSNASLGSGLFPLRAHVEHGVGVATGSDVGGGTGFSLVKEGLQAYFAQQLLEQAQPGRGCPLTPVHLLYLITRAGARALGLADQVGDLGVGKQFDATWLRPRPGSTLATNLDHATGPVDQLAKVFTLSTPGDVAAVWVGGDLLTTADGGRSGTTTAAPSSARPKEAA